MSNCGTCRNKLCTCHLIGSSSAQVVGTGSTYSPLHVRSATPAYRPTGSAYRNTTLTINANTDTVIPMQVTEEPFSSFVDMWKLSAPTRMTAPFTGLYMVGGMGTQLNDGSVGQVVHVWIAKNGVVTAPLVKRTTTNRNGTYNVVINVCTLIRLNAGEYIELYIRSNRTEPSLGDVVGGYGFSTGFPYMFANWMGG